MEGLDLAEYFITSHASKKLNKDDKDILKIVVSKSKGVKCERCWKILGGKCDRCEKVFKSLKQDG